MNESISRAEGAAFGEEFAPAQMAALIGSLGREPRQRTTRYGHPDSAAQARSWAAGELVPVSNARSVQQATLIAEV
jgi:FO synthase